MGKSKASFTLCYSVRSLVSRVFVKLINNECFTASVPVTVLTTRDRTYERKQAWPPRTHEERAAEVPAHSAQFWSLAALFISQKRKKTLVDQMLLPFHSVHGKEYIQYFISLIQQM